MPRVGRVLQERMARRVRSGVSPDYTPRAGRHRRRESGRQNYDASSGKGRSDQHGAATGRFLETDRAALDEELGGMKILLSRWTARWLRAEGRTILPCITRAASLLTPQDKGIKVRADRYSIRSKGGLTPASGRCREEFLRLRNGRRRHADRHGRSQMRVQDRQRAPPGTKTEE